MSSNPEKRDDSGSGPYVGKPHQSGERFFTGLLEWCEFSDKKPLIVAITGSTKYEQEFREAAERETAAGHIVLMPHIFRHSSRWKAFGISTDVADALDRLFSEFIKMADELLVVNSRGYIGEGTQRDIDCALNFGKKIRYTMAVKAEDIQHCFNPNCNSKESVMVRDGRTFRRVCKACGVCGPSSTNEYAADTGWNAILRYGNER